MAAVPPKIETIRPEDIDERAPFSENMIQKFAGMINYILLNRESQSLGEIRDSFLDETQFQAHHGTGWILCDGRSIVGSELESITTETLAPDGRGLFMRGKLNGAVINNPPAEVNLGYQTVQSAKNHGHNYIEDTSNFGLDATDLLTVDISNLEVENDNDQQTVHNI